MGAGMGWTDFPLSEVVYEYTLQGKGGETELGQSCDISNHSYQKLDLEMENKM